MTNPDDTLDRRNVLKLSGGGLAAMAGLAGCLDGGQSGDGTDTGSGGGDGADTDSSTDSNGGGGQVSSLTYWHKETGSKPLMKEMAQSFEGADISVNSFAESKMPQQLQSSLSANQAPHVVETKLRTAQLLDANDALSADSAQKVMERIGWDNWFDGPKSVVGGQDAYTVPYYAWILMTFHRKSVWEEKGLPKPTTWSNIEECAEAMHDPDNNKYGIGIGSKDNYFTTECFQNFALSNGARVFDADGEIVFDSDAMIEALEFYAHLHNEYGLPGQNSYPTIKQMYFNESISMAQWSDWLLPVIWEEASPEMAKDTGVVGYTEKKKKGTFGMVNTLSILNVESDAEQQAAEDFAYHMQQGEPYLKWVHSMPLGPNPTTKTTANSEAYKNGKYVPEAFQGMLEAFSEELSMIREGFGALQRFGTVDGNSFSAYGPITSKQLISGAVTRVIQGEDAQTVAEEQADKMRDEVSS